MKCHMQRFINISNLRIETMGEGFDFIVIITGMHVRHENSILDNSQHVKEQRGWDTCKIINKKA